ncbi:MAG: hypothetical protein GY800_01815 [Planctomycetes bacterium]|nr:hypothetical protein [Planctomycetota bacterium]
MGKTLSHGHFIAYETVHICGNGCCHASGSAVTDRAKLLRDRILPNSVVGYDVMVRIGLNRFLHHRQREEIRSELLSEHGISLSTGEISTLIRKFVDYFARLHRSKSAELRAALESDGGWPMHVDATGEKGRGTLFVVMAGWRKWVLGSWKIGTERSESIKPCIRQMICNYGHPCGAMRDLGRAIIPSLSEMMEELDLSIPILACHQHFLSDIGKDLLEPSHSNLRSLFRKKKVLANLRRLARELGRKIGSDIGPVRKKVISWQSSCEVENHIPLGKEGLAIIRSMAQWTLDYMADAQGLDFPYDRPYSYLYERCLRIRNALDAFLRIPPKDKTVVRALRRLRKIVDPVTVEVPFARTILRLNRRAKLFDELRDILRLTSKKPQDATENQLDAMRIGLNQWVESLKERRPKRGPSGDIRDAIDIIVKHMDEHGDNLWGHAIRLSEEAGGGVRLIDRTNWLLETFFKGMKHEERRRSGRKNLMKDLEHMPGDAPLVYNLQDPEYVRIICGALDKLHEAFAGLDRKERERHQKGQAVEKQRDIIPELQYASASLPTVDRNIVRTKEMAGKIDCAAKSRTYRRSAV